MVTDRKYWLYFLFIGFIGAFGALSVLLGQDANFDLKNYHLYNAFQFLDNRFYSDLNAAGYQSFFNPLLDVPFYTLATVALPTAPPLVAFIMGTYHAAMALAVVLIAQRVTSVEKQPVPFAAVAATVYIGLSGTNFISELGTTFNDVPAGALILCGLLFLLPLLNEDDRGATPLTRRAVIAGGLFGIATGLKLTTIIYAPAVVIAFFLSAQNARRSALTVTWFGVGFCGAFFLAAGWWNGRIFAHTGNPFFPLFNEIFRSDWYPPTAFFDNRFKPKTWAQIIAYPFYWLRPRSEVVTEVVFADPRFAIAYISVFLLALVYGRNHWLRTRNKFAHGGSRSQTFVVSFLIVSFVIWEGLFSIYRYAAALEVLIGIPVLLATVKLIDAIGVTRRRNTLVVTIMCGLAIVIQSWSVYPDWGRVPFGPKVFSIEAPRLPPQSLVVVAGLAQANSYILPFIKGDDVSFIGVTHTTIEARDFRLWKETAERIRHHLGSIFVLERFDLPYISAYTTSVLQELHVTVNNGQCNLVRSNLDQDITLCSASITE